MKNPRMEHMKEECLERFQIDEVYVKQYEEKQQELWDIKQNKTKPNETDTETTECPDSCEEDIETDMSPTGPSPLDDIFEASTIITEITEINPNTYNTHTIINNVKYVKCFQCDTSPCSCVRHVAKEHKTCKCGIPMNNICKCSNPRHTLQTLNNQMFCNSCSCWKCRC